MKLHHLLMTAGTILVFLGARDVFESYFGQAVAARNFTPASVTVSTHASLPPRIQVGDTVAKLSIPRLHTELYVVEGDNERELRRGPGHVPGSAMPGTNGNMVIAGHRDTHFRVLKDIRPGDDIVLQTATQEFHYKVRGTSVVSPHNTASLRPTDQPVLHLVTCYPFYWVGSAPKRFVVDAQLATEASRVE